MSHPQLLSLALQHVASSKWRDVWPWMTLATGRKINQQPAHISFIKRHTGKPSTIQICIRNKVEQMWEWGEARTRSVLYFQCFMLHHVVAAETWVILKSRWGSPTESPTAPSVTHLSLWYSLSFDPLLAPLTLLLASTLPHPKAALTNRQLLQGCLLKRLHKWISKDHGCSSGLFWLHDPLPAGKLPRK